MKAKELLRRSTLLLGALALMLCAGCAKGRGEAELRFSSFDGGGPSFRAVLDDPSLVSVRYEEKYHKKNHAALDGAGYDAVFRFRGLRSGQTRLRIEERSPIAGNADHLYELRVGEDLSVTLTLLTVEDPDAAVAVSATLVLWTEDGSLSAVFADNPTAAAFRDELSRGELDLTLRRGEGGDMYATLPFALEQRGEALEAGPGELLLVGEDTLWLLREEWSGTGTSLARIENAEALDILDGEGEIGLSLWTEWSE